MQIASIGIDRVCNESEVYRTLPLAGARILELGCGGGEKTRSIAEAYPDATILALEVDRIQHEKNRTISDLPNVRFEAGGAENISGAGDRFDIVFMFKSLHHVPLEHLDRALSEIRRVLVPGGMAYISEPIFEGDYNEMLRLFHDEEKVRTAAFEAVARAVGSGRMELVAQIFFKTRVRYRDFASFEAKVINVTHTQHRLAPALHEKVRARFQAHMTEQGAEFFAPMRVDLLRKPF
jgi:ubiquinone/menaquinone biosynthesis C-methylase UbiE